MEKLISLSGVETCALQAMKLMLNIFMHLPWSTSNYIKMGAEAWLEEQKPVNNLWAFGPGFSPTLAAMGRCPASLNRYGKSKKGAFSRNSVDQLQLLGCLSRKSEENYCLFKNVLNPRMSGFPSYCFFIVPSLNNFSSTVPFLFLLLTLPCHSLLCIANLVLLG